MANTSRVGLGFRPVKFRDGRPYNGSFNLYEVVAGDGTALAVGDLVKADAGTGTELFPTCIRLAASGQVTSGAVLGVVVGFKVRPGESLDLPTPTYRTASTKRIAMVADARDLVLEVEDGGTVPCTLSLIGNNTGVTCTAPTAATGASNMATGTTAPTTTVTLPLKIVGIVDRADNESAVASQKLHVVINTPYFGDDAVDAI
jgi:hypothetical protein